MELGLVRSGSRDWLDVDLFAVLAALGLELPPSPYQTQCLLDRLEHPIYQELPKNFVPRDQEALPYQLRLAMDPHGARGERMDSAYVILT